MPPKDRGPGLLRLTPERRSHTVTVSRRRQANRQMKPAPRRDGIQFILTERNMTMQTKPTARGLGDSALIAPCGMNCGLCYAFLRSRNKCPGCRIDDDRKPKTRLTCGIKNCGERCREKGDFCSSCARFACERLVRLDRRYGAKYGMSMIENLRSIETDGLRSFVKTEKSTWACPGCGEPLCVHKAFCLTCERKWR
jgi:hypothetical protein